MTMIAKFDGRCSNCGQAIERGSVIDWSKTTRKAVHASRTMCEAAVAATLAARAAAQTVPVESLDFSAVVGFLTAAHERGLKAPKVRFLYGAREVRLSLAKATGANPGAVYVKVDGVYVGLVAADGTMRGSRDAGDDSLSVDVALRGTLKTIAADPAAAAKAYAALMGRCSFCSLALTDAGSVEVGYGPICAKHYGLPHTALGTHAVQAVEAAA